MTAIVPKNLEQTFHDMHAQVQAGAAPDAIIETMTHAWNQMVALVEQKTRITEMLVGAYDQIESLRKQRNELMDEVNTLSIDLTEIISDELDLEPDTAAFVLQILFGDPEIGTWTKLDLAATIQRLHERFIADAEREAGK